MVLRYGSTYTKPAEEGTCPAFRGPGVRRYGQTYVKSPWYSSFGRFARPIFVDPWPCSTRFCHSGDLEGVAAVATVVTLVALIALAARVALSSECEYLGEECSSPDLFGNRLCQSVWNCQY